MDMQVRLTQFSHGGGCGCKIAPGVLEQILAKGAPGILPKELLVGIETSDETAGQDRDHDNRNHSHDGRPYTAGGAEPSYSRPA